MTDPAHLREWAPFDADRSLAAAGPVRLSTVGAPTPQVSETIVKRAEPRSCSSINGATATCAGSSSRSAKARASRSGTTSIAATSRGARRAGTSASTSWTGCSRASRSVAWSGPETIKFGGWQRLQAEYAKQFSHYVEEIRLNWSSWNGRSSLGGHRLHGDLHCNFIACARSPPLADAFATGSPFLPRVCWAELVALPYAAMWRRERRRCNQYEQE